MECEFCKIVSKKVSAEILSENDAALAFLDRSPVTAGHALVIPKRHATDLTELNRDEHAEFSRLIGLLSGAMKESLHCDGVMAVANEGLGQGVDHYHVHLLPRFSGDQIKNPLFPRMKYEDDYEKLMTAKKIRESAKKHRQSEFSREFLVEFSARLSSFSEDLDSGIYHARLKEFQKSRRSLLSPFSPQSESLESLKSVLKEDRLLAANFLRDVLMKENRGE